MSRSHIFATLTFLALSMVLSAQGASAASRADISAGVQASCTTDQTACLKAVNDQIATLSCSGAADPTNKRGCACSAQSLDVARGLADATTAVSKTNVALGTLMAAAVAKGAIACAQVAFGAVLDGTGTAAIAIPDANVPAGSAG